MLKILKQFFIDMDGFTKKIWLFWRRIFISNALSYLEVVISTNVFKYIKNKFYGDTKISGTSDNDVFLTVNLVIFGIVIL